MRTVVSRKEICELLNMSRTHLLRKLEQHGLKPVEGTAFKSKTLYYIDEVEKVFNIKVDRSKLKEVGNIGKYQKKEKPAVQVEEKTLRDITDEIGDILKE
jgi:hypothetical protein